MDQFASTQEKMTQEDILEACRNGDSEALNRLFSDNQKMVFSVANGFFGGNRQMAEDVTQKVFLRLFTNIATFRGEAKLETWLYRVTINLCIDEQKKKKRFLNFSGWFEPEFTAIKIDQDEKIYQHEISDEIRQAIGSLKIKFRLPILLKYVEELSYREMAEVLKCSEGTIASRLSRGLKMLGQKLQHLRDEL
jgi:RNA polymerase sigma-70 factor (ECF subfamily)